MAIRIISTLKNSQTVVPPNGDHKDEISKLDLEKNPQKYAQFYPHLFVNPDVVVKSISVDALVTKRSGITTSVNSVEVKGGKYNGMRMNLITRRPGAIAARPKVVRKPDETEKLRAEKEALLAEIAAMKKSLQDAKNEPVNTVGVEAGTPKVEAKEENPKTRRSKKK